jgi:antirestriction protein ArdC
MYQGSCHQTQEPEMPTQAEIRADIIGRLVESLEQGVIPWRKPWINDPNAGFPANVISSRRYSGANPLLLDLTAQVRGYTSKWWGTYKQWSALGGQVRRRPKDVQPGDWATSIIYFKLVRKESSQDGEDDAKTFPLMRVYKVFNVDQVDGDCLDGFRCGSTDDEATAMGDGLTLGSR